MKTTFIYCFFLFINTCLSQTSKPTISAIYNNNLLILECRICNWEKLSFKLNENDNEFNYQAFDDEGAFNVFNGIESAAKDVEFLITVKKRKGKIIFEGFKGTSWKIKEFNCLDNCKIELFE